MSVTSALPPLLGIVLAPLLLGVINRVKALFAGRRGQPLLQAYYDAAKLLRKGATYSKTTTWVFRLGPMAGLACVLAAVAAVPLGGIPAPLVFEGDLILLAYLLGLARFLTVVAALDTGSSFEGMGASREVQFSALAEPAFLLGLAALAKLTGATSLSRILPALTWDVWAGAGPVIALIGAAFLIVLLTENARIPVDDPNTHLELTMIHEVMVLDHSGPDFAFILYGAALKLWLFASVLAQTALPVHTGHVLADAALSIGGVFLVAVLVGVVESAMARLRLVRIPQMLVGAGALAVLALVLAFR